MKFSITVKDLPRSTSLMPTSTQNQEPFQKNMMKDRRKLQKSTISSVERKYPKSDPIEYFSRDKNCNRISTD